MNSLNLNARRANLRQWPIIIFEKRQARPTAKNDRVTLLSAASYTILCLFSKNCGKAKPERPVLNPNRSFRFSIFRRVSFSRQLKYFTSDVISKIDNPLCGLSSGNNWWVVFADDDAIFFLNNLCPEDPLWCNFICIFSFEVSIRCIEFYLCLNLFWFVFCGNVRYCL